MLPLIDRRVTYSTTYISYHIYCTIIFYNIYALVPESLYSGRALLLLRRGTIYKGATPQEGWRVREHVTPKTSKQREARKMETKKDVKGQDEKKAEKPVLCVAKTFTRLAVAGFKDREAFAEAILAEAKRRGITTNVRGHTFRKERIQQEISAIVRDINNERKGWWATFKAEENEKGELKLIKKPTQVP